jgi:hypothetical protein
VANDEPLPIELELPPVLALWVYSGQGQMLVLMPGLRLDLLRVATSHRSLMLPVLLDLPAPGEVLELKWYSFGQSRFGKMTSFSFGRVVQMLNRSSSMQKALYEALRQSCLNHHHL